MGSRVSVNGTAKYSECKQTDISLKMLVGKRSEKCVETTVGQKTILK